MATQGRSVAWFGSAAYTMKSLSRISRGSKSAQLRHEPVSTPSRNGVGAKDENGIRRTQMQPNERDLLPGPQHLPGDRLPRYECNRYSASFSQVPLHHPQPASKSLSYGNLIDMPHARFVVYPCKLKFARRIRRQRGERLEIDREYPQSCIASQRYFPGTQLRSSYPPL